MKVFIVLILTTLIQKGPFKQILDGHSKSLLFKRNLDIDTNIKARLPFIQAKPCQITSYQRMLDYS